MAFSLYPRTWYAMEYLFPSGHWHYSPVWVEEAVPRKTGKGLLLVRFYHANYSEGVRSKEYTIMVLRREEGYLLGFRVDTSSRSQVPILFLGMTREWLCAHFPEAAKALPDDGDLPHFLDAWTARVPR